MTDAEDSGTQETAEGSESADLADESPERSYRDAPISEDTAYESGKAQGGMPYRNTSKKIAAGKTGRRSSLEKAVSESNAGADSADCQKTKLFRNLAECIEAEHTANSDEDNDTENGAGAIICYKDKKTGELEFLLEQKPLDYPVPEAVGKLSLVGGAIQTKEKSLEALVRELREEIEEPAASLVIESLRINPRLYKRMPFEYKGIKGYTDIYVIEIMHESSWNVVKHAVFKHDAGFPRVLKQHELHVDDFAFGYGEIVKKFADDKSGRKKFTHFPDADSSYMDSLGSKKSASFPYANIIYSVPSLPSLYSSKYPLAGLQVAA